MLKQNKIAILFTHHSDNEVVSYNYNKLKENNPGVSEPKRLLFYTKKTIDENRNKIIKNMYQQMTLL